MYQINSGGPAVAPFAADQFVTGGTAFTSSNVVSTSGVTNAAPASVYQSERYGNFTYTLPVTANAAYTVRLHFAETYFHAVGARQFNVSINGTRVLTNFDIFALAGANTALVRDFSAQGSASGQLIISFVNVVDNPKSSAIEVFGAGQSTGTNQPPTVAAAASANPNPVAGTTSNLSVLGADDGGEAQLVYSWAAVGTPPAPVSFSTNGTNAAKSTTATFTQSGTYSLQVTIRDAAGSSTTSTVSVPVSIPSAPSTGGGAIYAINSGGPATGSFSSDSGFVTGGTAYISTAQISTSGVANAAPAAVYQSERWDDHTFTLGSLTPNGSYTVRLHFAELAFKAVGDRVFNVAINGTQVLTKLDIYATVGFNRALVYDFPATATSAGKITVHYINVVEHAKSSGLELFASGSTSTPTPTLSSVTVSPGSAQLNVNGTQQFQATARDQNGNALASQPAFSWTTSGGGTISASGLFTATSSGNFTVSATTSGKVGTASVAVSAPSSGPQSGDIVVNATDVRQRIDGFGASDKYATLSDAQADQLFSSTSGIGLSILRVAINPDGSDISPYANAQKAAARGAIVWGSPWSPPGEWKDNGTTGNGGHLLPQFYDAWAARLAGFATTMQQNGVTLYGISPQNEPDYTASWNSCLYSSDQMIAFIKVLGPKLAALSPRPKLIAPEVSNWNALWGYADPILADSTASSFTDIIATHDYTYSTQTHAAISKPLWETEVSTFDGPSRDIGNGIMVAKWIHRTLVVASASAWHYWWLIGQNGDNEGLIDVGQPSNKRLFTVGNFSKFVRPGQKLVGVTGPVPGGTSVSAYLNQSNGAVVIVVINENAGSTPVSFYVPGTHASATPWVTSANDDLAAKAAIAVSGGRFSATLAGQSVTTFVVP